MTEAEATSHLDDPRIRVTRWAFDAPHSSTGEHTHELDYVVVPITGGRLTVIGAGGERTEMRQEAGVPYLGRAGTRHEVVSGDEPVVFVEIELR